MKFKGVPKATILRKKDRRINNQRQQNMENNTDQELKQET